LIGIGLFTYFNSLFNKFVWDDLAYIVNNPEVSAINLQAFFGNSTSFSTYGFYKPISTLYFSVLFLLFKNDPFFCHLTQLLIHFTNSFLVYYLFAWFFKKKYAFFAAVIFLIHPINVESVAYMSASYSVIFFFFGMLALILGKKIVLNKILHITIGFLLLLSILARETGILFSALLICFYIFFKKKNIMQGFIAGICVSVIYAILRFGYAHVYLERLPLVPTSSLSIAERIYTMPIVILYYLKTFFFPLKLAVMQYWTIKTVTQSSFYLSLAIVFVFFFSTIFFAIYLYKKDKKNFLIFSFFSIWFYLGMLPISQIFPLDMTVADRWFYFPIVGLLGMLVVLWEKIKILKESKAAFAVILIIIIGFSLRTIIRNKDWFDSYTLYSHDVRINSSYNIEHNLGNELAIKGDYVNALYHLKKSVDYLPHETNLNNLGYLYKQTGDLKRAGETFRKALIAPSFVLPPHKRDEGTYVNYADYLFSINDLKNAEIFTKSALNDYPDSYLLWLCLGFTQYKLGKYDMAFESATKAYNLNQNNTTVYFYNRLKNKEPVIFTTPNK
jgi:protein O-mannosyl-transferase